VARHEVQQDEARIVRQIFQWIGRERISIGEVCRRRRTRGGPARSGQPAWDRSTGAGILKNPAYAGVAAFGKTRVGPLPACLRRVRGGAGQPCRAYGVDSAAPQAWIQRRHYACYRCCGSDAYRFGGGGLCANQQVRTGRLDEAVWREVERVLEDPRWIAAEYERRLGLGRLIDGYAEGLIDKAEFAPRAAGLRQRLRGWEEQAVQIRNEAAQRAALSLIVRRLEDFARPVRQRRAVVDWSMQRDLIRLPVKHAEIDREQVTVMLRVTPTPAGPGADPGSPNPNIGHVLHHCGRSGWAALGVPVPALRLRPVDDAD
jgi:site-specific DNA recombinase